MKKHTSSIKLLSLGMVGIILVTALVGGALALPTCVYALPPALLRARTIGELIITILAGANTAVTATPTVSGIYQACPYTYEEMITNGVLSVDGLTAQEAIDQLGQGNQLGRPYNLDTTAFRNLMSQNWQTMVDNNMDTVFRIGDIANTDATYGAIDNIGQIALNVANNGYLALENTVAVISNPGTAVTVGLQNIQDAFINTFGRNIASGVSIEQDLTGITGNYATGIQWITNKRAFYSGNFCMFGYYITESNGQEYVVPCVWNDTDQTQTLYYDSTGNYASYYDIARKSDYPGGNLIKGTEQGLFYIFPNVAEYSNWKNNRRSGNVDIPDYRTSPDVINTENGNATGQQTYDPSIRGGQGLDIISQDDYEDFLNDANDNTTNQDYPDNAIILTDLINDNLYSVPVPTQPPVVPDQPTVNPKPSIAPEMQEQVLTGTAPNLTTKFPFCLPFDLVKSFRVLEAEASAPHIEWNLQIERFDIDETIEIDLEPFTPVAEILRILLLLVFIVGLILLTRQIIGA